jgi:hypothetical protein
VYDQWSVPERSGPGIADGQAVLWMYHSHYEEIADVYSGLAGPLVIYKPDTLDAAGMPTDVDKEFFILYQVSPHISYVSHSFKLESAHKFIAWWVFDVALFHHSLTRTLIHHSHIHILTQWQCTACRFKMRT